MINLHRLARIAKPNATNLPSFWDEIDEDLKERRKNTSLRNNVFGQLILDKDAQLWDGEKTIHDWTESDQQLPSDEEVQARVELETDGRPAGPAVPNI
ncbi:hypothetical protein PGT21_033737 [Puccinia graminis f. sp. tritici]|nr:hypothetical protein PGT21_033737 [Puccinia graminis f. sp. tritici]